VVIERKKTFTQLARYALLSISDKRHTVSNKMEVCMLFKENFKRGRRLFWAFFRVGAFTFGGGYAMLPLLQEELVKKAAWVTVDQVMDDYALAQTIPGVIAVNSALLMGYRLAGLIGAVMAGLGVIIPSIIIIIAIAIFFYQIINHSVVSRVFQGVRAGVVGLIIVAATRFSKSAIHDFHHGIIAIIAFILAISTNIHVAFILFFAGVVGWFIPNGRTIPDEMQGRDKL
jgi:chromate transporter